MAQADLFPPTTTWVAPTSLPVIPDGQRVAIDTETCDRGLARNMGPGWAHGDGWLAGVSWAWAGGSGYAPVRHPDTPNCFDQELVLAWLRDLIRRCRVTFQNAGYDLGWTSMEEEAQRSEIDDTHAMAVLLDENHRNYGLDAIALRLGIPGKDEKMLREAAASFGIKDVKAEMWKMPARFVGEYAEQDAITTLGAAERMLPMMQGQDLMEAYRLEMDLSPYTVTMRRRGMPIDVDQAVFLQSRYRQMTAQILDGISTETKRRTVGMEEIRSPKWLAQVLGVERGMSIPQIVETGNYSFEKDWLSAQADPVCQMIVEARKLNDAAEKFIGNYILGFVHRGRMHAEIHQLRDADGVGSKGTRSYRFSYSNPPLQQMNRPDPDRADPEHKDFQAGFVDVGTEIRSCFTAEPGEVVGAPDYSQQEYRLIVHYASVLNLPKAEEAVRYYSDNADADYHNFVRDMTGLTRKRAKDCNFAKAFGAGIPKFALMTGMDLEEAAAAMNTYDEKLPFVAKFAKEASKQAEKNGYVRLLDRRRCRFDEWEASWIPKDEWVAGRAAGKVMTPCSVEEARRRQEDPEHPWRGKRLRRAGTHKAGNRVIQGGGAVQTKKAMRLQCRAGFIPMLQMHDELVHSVPSPEYARGIVECMEVAEKLRVPTRVDAEFGATWGTTKKSYEEAVRAISRPA